MRGLILAFAVGVALAARAQEIPVVPVDANHVRIGDVVYDICSGSSSDEIVFRGPSPTGQELVREVITAGCLRPDEADLSRHDSPACQRQ
jgi:hypothetical protein